jgi:hypothetical protein
MHPCGEAVRADDVRIGDTGRKSILELGERLRLR